VIPSRNIANLTACVKAIRAAGEQCRAIVVDDEVDWQLANPLYSAEVNLIAPWPRVPPASPEDH